MTSAMLQTLTRCTLVGSLALLGWNHPANATPDPATTDPAAPDPAKSDTAKSDPATPELLPGEPDVQGMALTPLMNAVLQNSKDEVARLIAAGADVNATGIFHYHQGVTPLMIAAYLWNDEIAKLLIEAGADVNAKSGPSYYPRGSTDAQNETALYMAEEASRYFGSFGGNPALTEPSVLPLVKRLIAAGADVNAVTRMGETPLMLAAGNLHLQVADALLKAGADINAKDLGKTTPLLHAAESGKPGFEKMIELLVFAPAKRAIENSFGLTPLIASLSNIAPGLDPSEAVSLLLSVGSDPNYTPLAHGTTPLMQAAGTGYLKSVKALLDVGASARALTINRETALHFLAASRRNAESVPIAKLLIKAGVDVNAQDVDGDSALLLAAMFRKKDLVDYLITAGADPKLKNRSGLSAQDVIKRITYWDPVFKEQEIPSADEEQLFYAAFSGNADQIRALVRKGVPLFAQTRTGEQLGTYRNLKIELSQTTFSEYAPSNSGRNDASKWDIVVYPKGGFKRDGYTTWTLDHTSHDLLIGAYAHVSGYDPFMMAAEQHRLDAVQAILDLLSEQHLSKERYYDQLGGLLLLAANVGYEDSVELLLKAGAVLNPTSETLATPLMAAIDGEHWKMAKRLIAAGANVDIARVSNTAPLHRSPHMVQHRKSLLLRAINKIASLKGEVPKEALELIQAMIDAGADVNAKDFRGTDTPLSLAERHQLHEIVRMLRAAGADPHPKTGKDEQMPPDENVKYSDDKQAPQDEYLKRPKLLGKTKK